VSARTRRRILAAVAACGLLAACQEQGRQDEAATAAPQVRPAAKQASQDGGAPDRASRAKLAYSHDLSLDLPADRLGPRFEAVRDRCLNEAVLACVVLQSSIRSGAGPRSEPEARLQVRLPHASVAPFLAFATAPLPGERAGAVTVREQATRAEDLARPVADVERRLAQLRAYRDRLTALAEKPDTRVENLVKIAGELSQAQTQIEEAEGRRRALEERIDTETVALVLRAERGGAGALAPIRRVWARGGETLGASAAAALGFAIASLPWIPILALGIVLIRALMRWRRRDRAAARDRAET
jgi:hypothetical protein